ncbi:hypothetical protein [Psychrobacillus sp.]|uniref:hypothetical protein n=1 Tax=Psychrobacillus sp. TaxID=1871623 RepID=UPI0028BDD613|nr:hypothetical protein [Psychrobacillus sp.]
MKKKYRTWNLAVIILCMLTIVFIVAVNYLVNPYNIFESPTYEGFNEQKIETKEYILKEKDLVNQKPDTIFLGSSRTFLGLDPSYYKKMVGEKAYNVGLAGASMDVELKYFEYVLKSNPKLKRVIIGLDFEAFNIFGTTPLGFSEERLSSKRWIKEDLFLNLFTIQAFIDSMRVIHENRNNISNLTQDTLLEDGSFNESVQLNIHQEMLNSGHNRFYEHLQEYLVSEQLLAKYELSNKNISYFKQLVDLCEENQIELIAFIQPAHALQWTGIEKAGLWEQLEQWKKEIVHITPVWDFSGYNSITTTSAENFDVYFDQAHYRKKVGNLILHKTLQIDAEKVPSDFGVYLTEENIQSHLYKIRADRDAWMADNPLIMQRIDELLPE